MHTNAPSFKRIFSFFGAAAYVFAVLVLLQFASIQIVLGFYDSQLSSSLALDGLAGNDAPMTVHPTVGLPLRLKIPKIHINAPIDDVGLLKDGSMGIPKLPSETAWYMLGPRPGEVGSAVIAGHVNWWYGTTGVFARLKTLKPGDLITVQDDTGTSTTFIVRSSRAIGIKDDPSSVFRSYDGKSHLNLVTCVGVWEKALKMYSKRLVVFADKVE